MLVGFGIHFWWPYETVLTDEEEAASKCLLTYLQSLVELEPSFSGIRLPGEGNWQRWEKPSPELIREFVEKQCVLNLRNGAADLGFRTVGYRSGAPHMASEIYVVADDGLLTQSDRVATILQHGIKHLSPTEAGAAYTHKGMHFWQRWVKSDRPRSPIPNIPFEAGWASEEALLDGTLYTWPEWEPAKLIR